MDVFKDQVYEEMDDLSKLIEPFEYSVNNELSQFPDEFEITPEMLNEGIASNWHDSMLSSSLESLVKNKANELGLLQLNREMRNNYTFVQGMFKIDARLDEEEGTISYDAATGELCGGKLFIIKTRIAIEDREIEAKMASYAHEFMRNNFNSAREVNRKNLNQIAELFGATEARQERAALKKVRRLALHLKKLVEERKLVIKDFDLFKRFIQWNILFIKNGNLPAMANIAKVKIMMRSGNPIYSIKEEQV